jgi:hypothetical protein
MITLDNFIMSQRQNIYVLIHEYTVLYLMKRMLHLTRVVMIKAFNSNVKSIWYFEQMRVQTHNRITRTCHTHMHVTHAFT